MGQISTYLYASASPSPLHHLFCTLYVHTRQCRIMLNSAFKYLIPSLISAPSQLLIDSSINQLPVKTLTSVDSNLFSGGTYFSEVYIKMQQTIVLYIENWKWDCGHCSIKHACMLNQYPLRLDPCQLRPVTVDLLCKNKHVKVTLLFELCYYSHVQLVAIYQDRTYILYSWRCTYKSHDNNVFIHLLEACNSCCRNMITDSLRTYHTVSNTNSLLTLWH